MFLWVHSYCCYELLVTSALGFKARVKQSLTCMKLIPQIHLWCDNCWPLDDQQRCSTFLNCTHTSIGGTRTWNRVCGTVCALTVWTVETSFFIKNSSLQQIKHYVLTKKCLPLRTICKTCFQQAFSANIITRYNCVWIGSTRNLFRTTVREIDKARNIIFVFSVNSYCGQLVVDVTQDILYLNCYNLTQLDF